MVEPEISRCVIKKIIVKNLKNTDIQWIFEMKEPHANL
jgi:hypothetical protein